MTKLTEEILRAQTCPFKVVSLSSGGVYTITALGDWCCLIRNEENEDAIYFSTVYEYYKLPEPETDKKYEYIEYEKLSDAVRDWELHRNLFTKYNGEWANLNGENGEFSESKRYAKRIEVKKEPAKSVLLEGIIEEYFIYSDVSDIVENADYHARLMAKIIRDNVKLTGTIKE